MVSIKDFFSKCDQIRRKLFIGNKSTVARFKVVFHIHFASTFNMSLVRKVTIDLMRRYSVHSN